MQLPKRLIADRAYDATALRDRLARCGVKGVIPPNPTRKHPHRYDKKVYKSRNLVEPPPAPLSPPPARERRRRHRGGRGGRGGRAAAAAAGDPSRHPIPSPAARTPRPGAPAAPPCRPQRPGRGIKRPFGAALVELVNYYARDRRADRAGPGRGRCAGAAELPGRPQPTALGKNVLISPTHPLSPPPARER
jgi:transposase